jgi:hypothetical protein
MIYRAALVTFSLFALSACEQPKNTMPVPGTVIAAKAAAPATPAKAVTAKVKPRASTSTKKAAAAPARKAAPTPAPASASGRKKVVITEAPSYTASAAAPKEVVVDLYD